MKKMPEEYLWMLTRLKIYPLQDIFGLHPLTVEAILHHNQPSKIEDYARYIFAIIYELQIIRKRKWMKVIIIKIM